MSAIHQNRGHLPPCLSGRNQIRTKTLTEGETIGEGGGEDGSMAEHCSASEKGDDRACSIPSFLVVVEMAAVSVECPSKRESALRSCKGPKTHIAECREQEIKRH